MDFGKINEIIPFFPIYICLKTVSLYTSTYSHASHIDCIAAGGAGGSTQKRKLRIIANIGQCVLCHKQVDFS